jgi:hypothetical protein
MKQLTLATLAALALWLIPATPHAQAQPYYQRGIGTYTAPVNPVSPYINLANGNPAVSFFGLVQPQIQLQTGVSQLQQQVATDSQTLGAMQNLPLTTGHGVQFMSFNRYFMRTPLAAPGGAANGGFLTSPLTAGSAAARVGATYTAPALQRGYR